MRFLLLAFLALPAFAQAPAQREIRFMCRDGVCYLEESDWKWMMESAMEKDRMLAKCGWKNS